ncbi:hypothetical protein [uncultured Sneathiella sp.]|mgnify:FL=1|jgi:hypothetical protein|uniref:hypothetical protein n=1 Tax=uncultured Sneathiella sp. TaxID=879315 RepID=UPI0030D6FDDA|tara:strand:+ start:10545 stop:11129 length:585 start_codon:yes stop_codon:yes gene_type:complete
MATLKVGPVLGLEGETAYTVVFSATPDVQAAEWVVGGTTKPCKIVGSTPGSTVWRGEHKITAPAGESGKEISYQIKLDGAVASCGNGRTQWTFYVPGKGEQPTFAYGSCNGFSDLALMHKTENPYRLWQKMAATNDRTEYLDEAQDIRISMLTPFASDQYIRARNFVTLELGTDDKLWINWESEVKDTPVYPIE